MSENKFCTSETAWCPGCGNFSVLEALKQALVEIGKKPHEVLLVGGIGQAAKTPQYLSANSFCGLHGRALPPAAAAKIANKDLTVIVDTGDGDSYGEGGNHFIHNVRRNVDITHFVHDNQIYGLTKGQASPTTSQKHITDVQSMGNMNEPFNPILMAIAAGAGFVARAFSGDKEHLVEIMKQAINYKGYALVDIFSPCISFNKVNTFMYYKKRVYKLDEGYDYSNKLQAMEKAMELDEKIPIGVIYKVDKTTFNDKFDFLNKGKALVNMSNDRELMENLMSGFK